MNGVEPTSYYGLFITKIVCSIGLDYFLSIHVDFFHVRGTESRCPGAEALSLAYTAFLGAIETSSVFLPVFRAAKVTYP